MELVFLGTASCFPTASRGVSCIALRHEDGFVWLFDCGEGSQIQLQKSCIRPGKITKIFITHLHGDHLFGLPGLICTISTQCSVKSDFVLEIYGPQGLRQYVRQSLMLSRSELPFKYVVHELVPESYQFPPDWTEWTLPETSETKLHQQEIIGRDIKAVNDTWILIERGKNKTGVIAGHNEHLRIPSFGFVVQEPDMPGKLDVELLRKLNCLPGPQYAQLKQGLDIRTTDGVLIESHTVLGPVRIGRKVTILGDTCNSDKMIDISSDILVHEATLENSMLQNALEKGHSTPDMAAAFAHSINARMLVLTHFSQRYQHLENASTEDACTVQVLLEEAQHKLAALKNSECSVILANDLLQVPVPRYDGKD